MNSKKAFFKATSFLILTAGIFAISLIEARAAILSTIIVFLLLILFYVYKLVYEKNEINKVSKKILVIISPCLIAFLLNIFAINLAIEKGRKSGNN